MGQQEAFGTELPLHITYIITEIEVQKYEKKCLLLKSLCTPLSQTHKMVYKGITEWHSASNPVLVCQRGPVIKVADLQGLQYSKLYEIHISKHNRKNKTS